MNRKTTRLNLPAKGTFWKQAERQSDDEGDHSEFWKGITERKLERQIKGNQEGMFIKNVRR